MTFTFDSKCYDLAKAFLEEYEVSPGEIEELAREIQRTIEDFIAIMEEQ